MYKHVFIEGNHLKQALEFDLRILQLSSGQFSAELIISDWKTNYKIWKIHFLNFFIILFRHWQEKCEGRSPYIHASKKKKKFSSSLACARFDIFTAVKFQVRVFWVLTSLNDVVTASILVLRNIGILSQHYTASEPRISGHEACPVFRYVNLTRVSHKSCHGNKLSLHVMNYFCFGMTITVTVSGV